MIGSRVNKFSKKIDTDIVQTNIHISINLESFEHEIDIDYLLVV